MNTEKNWMRLRTTTREAGRGLPNAPDGLVSLGSALIFTALRLGVTGFGDGLG